MTSREDWKDVHVLSLLTYLNGAEPEDKQKILEKLGISMLSSEEVVDILLRLE